MNTQILGRHTPKWKCSLWAALFFIMGLAPSSLSHAASLTSSYGRIEEPGVWLVKDNKSPRESLIRKLRKGTYVHILGHQHPWLEVEVLRGENTRGFVGHRYVAPLSASATQRLLERRLATQQKEQAQRRRQKVLEDIEHLGIAYRRSEVPKVWLVERPSNPTDTIIRKLPHGTPMRVLRSSQGWSRVVVIDDEPTAGWILDSLTTLLDEDDAIDAHLAFSRSLEPGHASFLTKAVNEPLFDSRHGLDQATHPSGEKRLTDTEYLSSPLAMASNPPRLGDEVGKQNGGATTAQRAIAPALSSKPNLSQQEAAEPPFEMDYTPLFAVICMLCFLFVGSKLKGRLRPKTLTVSSDGLVELNSLHLTKHERITLVQAAGRLLVMATGSHGVQVLTELPAQKGQGRT